jgi:ABC-2 type transport system permease protein
VQGILFANVLGPRIDPAMTSQWVTFSIPLYLLMAATPVLTMRLLSEETASGTIETMMTAPVTEAELMLGKFAGVLVFAMVMFLPLAAQMAFLALHGPVDVGAALAGCMGLFLLAAQFLSIGLLCSALTRVQIAAAIMAFAALLALSSVSLLAGASRSAPARAVRYLSAAGHYAGFSQGIVDTRDVAYFVLTTALLLVLTVRALQLRKWR